MILVIYWTEFERPIYNEIYNCETPSNVDMLYVTKQLLAIQHDSCALSRETV